MEGDGRKNYMNSTGMSKILHFTGKDGMEAQKSMNTYERPRSQQNIGLVLKHEGQSQEWIEDAAETRPRLRSGRGDQVSYLECGEAPHYSEAHYDNRLPSYLCPRSAAHKGFNPNKGVHDAVRYHGGPRRCGLRRVPPPKKYGPRKVGIRRGYKERLEEKMEERLERRNRIGAFRYFYDHDENGIPKPVPKRNYSHLRDQTWDIFHYPYMNNKVPAPTPPLPLGAAIVHRAAPGQMATGKRVYYKNRESQPLW
eukprot:g6141.t1